jgi:hypothetical protein
MIGGRIADVDDAGFWGARLGAARLSRGGFSHSLILGIFAVCIDPSLAFLGVCDTRDYWRRGVVYVV